MSILRVKHLPEFHFGDDAVLVALDAAGLDVLTAALEQALTHGDSRLEHDGQTHHIAVQAGAADVELHDDDVQWLLDRATMTEIIDKLAALKNTDSGHHYVDIATPASTLVLSLGEYLDAI